GRISCLCGRFNCLRSRSIEAARIAVVALCCTSLEFIAKAKVQGQSRVHPPVVVNKHSVPQRLVRTTRVSVNRSTRGLTEQQARKFLADFCACWSIERAARQ